MKVSIPCFAVVLTSISTAPQVQANATICVSGHSCDDRDRLAPVEIIRSPAHMPPLVIEPSPLILLPFQDATGSNHVFAAPSQTLSADMPYFDDGNMFAMSSPGGWPYTVQVHDMDDKAIATWQKLSASSAGFEFFSFKSPLPPSEATYQFTFDDGTARSQQLFMPLSPNAKIAGYTGFTAPVPEPSAAAWAALGLLTAVRVTGRRKAKSKLTR